MDQQVDVAATVRADGIEHDGVHEITGDVAYKRLFMVNVW